MTDIKRQTAFGLLGGAASVCLTLWLRYYMPETDSFADIRDVPSILLAFFVGPLAALVSGMIASFGRAAVGLFGGIGASTWFGSSLATFGATLVAVVARRYVFSGERPSFALGAAIAAIVEMLHMAVVLSIGFAEFSNAFAVIVAAIPFQCGGAAVAVAAVSLLTKRRQDGRENLSVSALVVTVVVFVVLVYFAMAHQAKDMAAGLMPNTSDYFLYPCHLATVLYGIVLSALLFVFVVYAKRSRSALPRKSPRGEAGGFRIGLRARFAISLAVMLGVIGGLVGWVYVINTRGQCEHGYGEAALRVADFLAKYIDGERTRGYRESGRKDDYYHEVERLLGCIRIDSNIQYLFVAVPDEKGVTYVWDTDVGDLGVRDDSFEPDELRVYSAVIRDELDKASFVHRSETYGRLMSAAAPIRGSDGRPVAFVGVDMSMDYIDSRINRIVFSAALLTLALVILCLAGYYFFVSRFIVSPAELRLQAEEGRIHAELNVARRIQSDALPSVFPAFPGRTDFDIYAMMSPAKEVGGDFYDFFLIDDSHLALVIGDVSDKGVPAALFMMTTKTLVRARASRGGTPGEILRDVNDRLCEGNASGMFVTVYLAVIDLRTGECLSANAGHEHPAVCRAGGTFELVKYPHDPMLGLVPGLTYSDRAFRLSSGDMLCVYTDGVPEAKNADGQVYGMARMTDALDRARGGDAAGLLGGLLSDVHAFVGKASQFDDITLLAVTYRGAMA